MPDISLSTTGQNILLPKRPILNAHAFEPDHQIKEVSGAICLRQGYRNPSHKTNNRFYFKQKILWPISQAKIFFIKTPDGKAEAISYRRDGGRFVALVLRQHIAVSAIILGLIQCLISELDELLG
ncbi:MAG: hypothetical protein N4A65_16175 [Cohaesibacter sp.]|jgi:hypothetical protein|nr:hypothetical protein [Cohaesibacter sp.]